MPAAEGLWFSTAPRVVIRFFVARGSRRTSAWVSFASVIPVAAKIVGVRFTTSLFPRDETYLVPLKVAVRRKVEITVGDEIEVELAIGAG